MDETTLKTVDNAVVICAESAKNATESATKALEAKQDVDARVAELGETIQSAKEDIKRAEDAAQSASKSAESANQSAIIINNAKDEIVRIGAQITTDKALIKGYASTASSGASRAEEAKRVAVNASESIGGMQDEINATKSKIDATAKTVQSNADAVANAKTAVETAKTQAETAKSDAVKAQGEASKSAEQASTSASNAATSATASATSASQAQEFATQAQGAVVNTLKRQEYADGAIYSTIFTQLASVVTLDKAKIKALTDAKEPTAQTGLLAYKDRYLMITTSGWVCLNGDTLDVISAGKWGEKTYIPYALSKHWNIAFNGERIAVFYRFNENTPNNRHAEVFNANTGERLVDKTFTDAEMSVITSAPNKVTMSCFTKDGDIVYWGSVFDQELTHKGYVQAVDGLPKIGASHAYCCYVDNENYDAPIMYTTQACSVWLDDRYTLDEDGKPILTFRGFDPDGKGMGGDRRIQFSQYSKGYGWSRHNVAVCSQHNGNVSVYDVTIDPTTEEKFVFTNGTPFTNVKIEQVTPTNFFTKDLVYTYVSFYVKKGVEVYAAIEKTLGSNPVAILEGENETTYDASQPLLPSVSFTSQKLRPIPLRYPFYDGEALLWTRQIK